MHILATVVKPYLLSITAQREGPALIHRASHPSRFTQARPAARGCQRCSRSRDKNLRRPGRFLHRPIRPRRRASAAKKKKARRTWHTPGPSQGGKRPSLGDQAAAYEDQASSVPQRPPWSATPPSLWKYRARSGAWPARWRDGGNRTGSGALSRAKANFTVVKINRGASVYAAALNEPQCCR